MHRLAAAADCAPVATPAVPVGLTEATAPAATVTGWIRHPSSRSGVRPDVP